MLTPTSISGNSVIASRKAKRGWLRNSRWLYSNSLSVLIENNKAVERQQIFADILGFGHLASTLCSGQLIPDTELSFSSATAGASPSLN
jgi:exonuclease SbcC